MSKEERKACVKELRAVARELDVSQIRDDCGRSEVQEWFQSVVRAATSKKKPDLKAKTPRKIHFGVPEVSTTFKPHFRTHQRHLEKSTSVCRKFRQLLYRIFELIRDTTTNPIRCAESLDNFFCMFS